MDDSFGKFLISRYAGRDEIEVFVLRASASEQTSA